MLKNIPLSFSPELFSILMQMGHGDEIILADANFPAANNAKRLVYAMGIEIDRLLNDILQFMPLDNFMEKPVALMQAAVGCPTPSIWDEYKKIIKQNDFSSAFNDFEYVERIEFYERAKTAYAIVQCATSTRYANIILKKGII